MTAEQRIGSTLREAFMDPFLITSRGDIVDIETAG